MSASGSGPLAMFADGGQEMLEWFETRLITIFGRGNPSEQTAVSLLLAVVTWSTSFITVGVSVILALIFTATFLWGTYRIITEGPGGSA